ncbi:MAG: hypothetical protein U0941_29230 [Planctomycetaceae bacterium]
MHDDAAIENSQSSQWCLVGNIVDIHEFGEQHEVRHGTKHFASGTKVYCLPAQWGDGYERITVIGRHRGSKQFNTMIIRSAWVTNWRAKVVYHPEVLRRLNQQTGNWQTKEQVEEYVRSISQGHDSPSE